MPFQERLLDCFKAIFKLHSVVKSFSWIVIILTTCIATLLSLVTKSNKKDTILWFSCELRFFILLACALSLYHHHSKIGALDCRHEHRPKNRATNPYAEGLTGGPHR